MTNDTTAEVELKVTQHVQAPPDKVFDAWLDPALLARFMRPVRADPPPSVNVDPQVGGSYEFMMGPPDSVDRHWGKYLEITRPDRLVFTWNSPHAAPDSVVSITFREVNDGTEVTLTHDRFPSAGSREGHRKGWTAILETLAGSF